MPLDHADSTYRLWKEEIFEKVPSFHMETNVLAIDPLLSPQDCAMNYYSRLKDFLSLSEDPSIHAAFIDLSILGMGPDGHTASLFPEHPLVTSCCNASAPIELLPTDDPRVKAMQVMMYLEDSPKPPPNCVTFSLHALTQSPQVSEC